MALIFAGFWNSYRISQFLSKIVWTKARFFVINLLREWIVMVFAKSISSLISVCFITLTTIQMFALCSQRDYAKSLLAHSWAGAYSNQLIKRKISRCIRVNVVGFDHNMQLWSLPSFGGSTSTGRSWLRMKRCWLVMNLVAHLSVTHLLRSNFGIYLHSAI